MIDPRLILIGLLLLAAAALVILLVARRTRIRDRAGRQAERAAAAPGTGTEAAQAGTQDAGLPAAAGGGIAGSFLRWALLVSALGVVAGFLIVVLPQGAIDWLAGTISARVRQEPAPEKIAFLYLGDELKQGEFHIRGVIRNITVEPIEKLDATIRLYAPGGQLVETRTVRMDSELIAPDQTAQFHLVYPDYKGQFGSYSIEFVMRQGDVVPYKDMRSIRGRE
ncbi:MAG: hypothetical protein HXY20_06860 [Acidobacteria bacterium]|nr:hypothetical protein [Acidobacteriota bacterium]